MLYKALLDPMFGMYRWEARQVDHLLPLFDFIFSDILVDLMFNSREFQYEILPAIVKSYRTAQSSEKFKYTKVQSVHNRELLKQVGVDCLGWKCWVQKVTISVTL